jgi:hypothetical protein
VTGDKRKQTFLLSPVTCHLLRLLGGCAVLAVACEEAGAAVDGATLRRIEGDGGLLPALRALHGDFDSLAHTRCLRGGNGGEPFILGLLARFAPLGFILQTFVVKEDLLASRPDEIISTVNAFNRAVFEFSLRITPLPV